MADASIESIDLTGADEDAPGTTFTPKASMSGASPRTSTSDPDTSFSSPTPPLTLRVKINTGKYNGLQGTVLDFGTPTTNHEHLIRIDSPGNFQGKQALKHETEYEAMDGVSNRPQQAQEMRSPTPSQTSEGLTRQVSGPRGMTASPAGEWRAPPGRALPELAPADAARVKWLMLEGVDRLRGGHATRALGSFRDVLRIDANDTTAREWVATIVKMRADEAIERSKMEQKFITRADEARERKRMEEERMEEDKKAAEKRNTSCWMYLQRLSLGAVAAAGGSIYKWILDRLRARHSEWMDTKLTTSMDTAGKALEAVQEAMVALQWQTMMVTVSVVVLVACVVLGRWLWATGVVEGPEPAAEGSADDVECLRAALAVLDNRLEMANHEVDTLNDALDDRHAELVEANAAVSNLVEELAADRASTRGYQTWSEHGRTMEPVDLAALAAAEASLAALQAQLVALEPERSDGKGGAGR